MKKLLSVLLVLSLLSPACALMEAAVQPLTQEDFAFRFEDVSYQLGAEAAPLIKAISEKNGQEMTVTEADSLLFSGKDRDYAGEGIIVSTYPTGKDGADAIETVMVLVQDYQTARGAHVGMTLDDIAALYGDEFTLDFDQMIYTLGEGQATLTFAIDADSDTALCWTLSKNTAN